MDHLPFELVTLEARQLAGRGSFEWVFASLKKGQSLRFVVPGYGAYYRNGKERHPSGKYVMALSTGPNISQTPVGVPKGMLLRGSVCLLRTSQGVMRITVRATGSLKQYLLVAPDYCEFVTHLVPERPEVCIRWQEKLVYEKRNGAWVLIQVDKQRFLKA